MRATWANICVRVGFHAALRGVGSLYSHMYVVYPYKAQLMMMKYGLNSKLASSVATTPNIISTGGHGYGIRGSQETELRFPQE